MHCCFPAVGFITALKGKHGSDKSCFENDSREYGASLQIVFLLCLSVY